MQKLGALHFAMKKVELSENLFNSNNNAVCAIFTASPTPSPTRPLGVPYTSPTSPTKLHRFLAQPGFGKPAIQRVGPTPRLCPTCWSRWVLRGEMQRRRQGGHAIDEFMANAAVTIGELHHGRPCPRSRVASAGLAVRGGGPGGEARAGPLLRAAPKSALHHCFCLRHGKVLDCSLGSLYFQKPGVEHWGV